MATIKSNQEIMRVNAGESDLVISEASYFKGFRVWRATSGSRHSVGTLVFKPSLESAMCWLMAEKARLEAHRRNTR